MRTPTPVASKFHETKKNQLNICVLRIASSDEQQNANKSRHDGKRKTISIVHLNRRTLYRPRVQRKERRLSTRG
jgi:hypothetical protein